MQRFIRTVIFFMGAFALGVTAAAAGEIKVMVVANASQENGLDENAVNLKLEAMMAKLAKSADVNLIWQVRNMTKPELETRLETFRSQLNGADFVMFYFLGPGAHDDQGRSYLIPAGWNEKSDGLVSLMPLLNDMRANAKGNSLLILDALRNEKSWTASGVQPGFGKLETESDSGVTIIYNDSPALPSKDGTLVTDALDKRMAQPVSLKHLASLVQEDVSLESSGASVPRIIGRVSSTRELNPEGKPANVEEKAKSCRAANAEKKYGGPQLASAGTAAVQVATIASVIPASARQDTPDTKGTSAAAGSNTESAADDWFYCPFAKLFEPPFAAAPNRPAVVKAAPAFRPAFGGEARKPVIAQRPVSSGAGHFASSGSARADVRAAAPGG